MNIEIDLLTMARKNSTKSRTNMINNHIFLYKLIWSYIWCIADLEIGKKKYPIIKLCEGFCYVTVLTLHNII